ncbi:MAG TPA: hypothetical protein PLG43_14730, partial [Spirochaetia bacterium]|nr:hypothetical protein [Spirochaetia bacterium]
FGREPHVDALTRFRGELYKLTDEAVRLWIADKKFLLRFTISALAFLVTYLFFSLFIRDPLPMIDELVLGILAAIGCYSLLLKRDLTSSQAVKKRVELKNLIDAIVFTEDPFVRSVEDSLIWAERANEDEILDSFFRPLQSPAGPDDELLRRKLIECIEVKFGPKLKHKQERLLRKIPAERGKLKKSLSRLTAGGSFDLSLFATYSRVKLGSENR